MVPNLFLLLRFLLFQTFHIHFSNNNIEGYLERVIEKLPYFGKAYKADKEKERQRAEKGDDEPGNSFFSFLFLKIL